MSRHLFRQPAVIVGKRVFHEWTVTPPSDVNGSDIETQYSDFVTIPDPKPVGSGLFGVPAIGLHGAGTGLALSAEVEFHNETEGLISSSALGGLSLPGEVAVVSTSFGFSGWAPSDVGPGAVSYTSDWSAIGPIPYDAESLWVVSWECLMQTNTTYNIDLSAAIDLGDDSGVLISIDPIHQTVVIHPDWHPGEGSADTTVVTGADEVSWTGTITRARYRISGNVEAGLTDIYANIAGALSRIHAAI